MCLDIGLLHRPHKNRVRKNRLICVKTAWTVWAWGRQKRGASFHFLGITRNFLLIFMQPLLCRSSYAKAMLELFAYFLFQDRK